MRTELFIDGKWVKGSSTTPVYDPADGSVDTRYFEGSHSETENNYMVLMYHRNQTMNYDELIGYGLENTRGKR